MNIYVYATYVLVSVIFSLIKNRYKNYTYQLVNLKLVSIYAVHKYIMKIHYDIALFRLIFTFAM